MNERIYVKEKPKSCFDCIMLANKDGAEAEPYCVLNNEYLGDYEHCPLKLIHDHDKELVEKVLEKVSIELENETETYCEIKQCTSPHYQGDYVWFNYVKFRKFIDQIQKEFEDE